MWRLLGTFETLPAFHYLKLMINLLSLISIQSLVEFKMTLLESSIAGWEPRSPSLLVDVRN